MVLGLIERTLYNLDLRPYITFGVDMSSSVHVDNKKRCFNSW